MKTILLLVASLVLTAGCSSGGSDGSGGQGATGGADTTASGGSGGAGGVAGTGGSGGQGGVPGTGGATAAPTVTLAVDPTTMMAGDTVTATVGVTDFVLEAPAGQPNQTGHGHYHIYLDDAAGGDYLIADQVASVHVQIPQSVSLGAHKLRVSLGGNDHAPLVPAVQDIVDIMVVAP